MELHSVEQTREIDAHAISGGTPGIVLMKRAAQAVLDEVRQVVATKKISQPFLTVFCGSGNNAGDGFLVARLASEAGFKVSVFELVDDSRYGGDAALARTAMLDSGIVPKPWSLAEAESVLNQNQSESVIVIDALLGTGVVGKLRPAFAEAVDFIAQIKANLRESHIVAVDVPSGLCANTGRVLDNAVQADSTVTFITIKKGLLTAEAPDYVGRIVFNDLAVAESREQFPCYFERSDLLRTVSELPRRKQIAHKYSTAAVSVLAGGKGMGGAGILCASAALRTASGLVHLHTHENNVGPAMAFQPELLIHAVDNTLGSSDMDCSLDQALEVPLIADKTGVLVIGPGFGRGQWAKKLLAGALTEVLESTRSGKELKLVLDADALFLIGESPELAELVRDIPQTVLTPHMGEAKKLLPTSEQTTDRFALIKRLVSHYKSTVVLKGAGTLVGGYCENAGDELPTAVCPYGNSILATAGTGDVLAGVIGGFLGAGLTVREASLSAVTLHGAAADAWLGKNGRMGFTAGCLLDALPALVNEIEGA